jgi:hypothetical protein
MPTLQPMRLPIPVNEARVLVTICDDDSTRARSKAVHNYRSAQTDREAAFWFGVVQVLTLSASPQA